MDETFLDEGLQQLDQASMRRRLRTVEGPQGRVICVDGRQVINFCSNDYLGLANDERIKQAAVSAIETQGFGSGASRLICGNNTEHLVLEQKIADLKATEAALVFSSGFMANTGIIPALFDREDIILSDRFNHASIIDGIIISRAQFKRYAHNDMQALENELKQAADFKKRLIVTDSVFSMDGDRANLKAIVELARRYDAWVMVDEAHGFGVLGAHGAGLVEQEGLTGEIDIQMGTLSKAAGCFGAYLAGSRKLREYLINHARSFIYTTAMPASSAAAASKAIEIIQEEPERRQKVLAAAALVRQELQMMGFDTMNSTTPIIPILMKDSAAALKMSAQLLEQGILALAIRPPTVPVNTARLRLTITASHTKEDLGKLLKAMKSLR